MASDLWLFPFHHYNEPRFVLQSFRQEFVDAYVNYIFNVSIHEWYTAFSTGFLKVCGGKVLELFQPSELRAMIVGSSNYNWKELEEVSWETTPSLLSFCGGAIKLAFVNLVWIGWAELLPFPVNIQGTCYCEPAHPWSVLTCTFWGTCQGLLFGVGMIALFWFNSSMRDC